MQLVRRILISILTTFLMISLLLTALFWTLNNTVGQRGTVKDWLDSSGIYDDIIDQAADEARKSVNATNGSDIDGNMLARAIDKTFTPAFLQDKTEQILDGTYDWLEGTSPALDFTIDLSRQKTDLAANLTDEIRIRLNALPACTNLSELESFDPFTSNCKPPELDARLQEFEDDFVNSREFLPNPVIHASDLKVGDGDNKQSLDEAFGQAPTWYRSARNLIWAAALTAVLSAIGILLLSQPRRTGLKHLTVNLSVAAILLLIYGLLLNRLSGFINFEQAAQQIGAVKSLVEQVAASFAAWSFKSAGLYGLLAAGGIVYLILSRQRKPPTPAEGEQPSNDIPGSAGARSNLGSNQK